MKRVARGVRRIATGLVLAALVLLALWVGLVPRIVERLITEQFEAAGLPKPTLRIRGLSLSHLEMTNLAAGEDGRLRIGAVGVDYRLSQLLAKRIDSIEIIGLEAEVRHKDGAWDLGPLAGLHLAAGGEAPAEMPFRRIALRASTLILDLDGRRLRIPLDGSVENAGQDTLAIDLATGLESVALRIAGTVNTGSQDFHLALTGDVPDLAALLPASPGHSPASPPPAAAAPDRAWGGVAVKADLSRAKGVLGLDATAEGAGWRLSRLEVRETGLEDLLRGKADRAGIRVHWDAEAEKPWLLVKATPLGRWIDGAALAKAELSGDGIVELSRAKAGAATGWTWSATVPAARATLAPSDLSVPAAGAALEGAQADLRLAATADAAGLRVTVLPGSWIGFKSAVAKAGDEVVRVGAAHLAFAGRGEQPVLAAALESGRLVSVDGALTAEAAGPVTASAGEGVAATLGTIRSAAECAWGEKGGSLTAGLEIGGIAANLNRKFGDTLIIASVPEAGLLLKTQRDFAAAPDAPLSIEFALTMPTGGKGASVAAAGVEAAGRVEARGTLALAAAAPPAIEARVSLADASVQHKEAGLALAGITADVPLTWNLAASPEPGAFAVKSVALKGSALAAISGTLAVADTRADFTVDWPVLPGAALRVEGSAALGGRGPSARAYVSLPLFEIKDEEAVGRLVPQLKGVLVSGSFALDGYVRASAAGLAPNIALTVLDATVKSKAWEADAEGVYATVRINSFQPVLTPRKELQVALVRHAKMGKLDVNDGFVAFRIEPKEETAAPAPPGPGPSAPQRSPAGWTAWVQRGEWGWAGGRLYVEDFRFDPDAAAHTVTVSARDLKLRDLLALIPNEEASGVGSLDGGLTVTVGTWPDLRFGEGELRTPPGQTGWFKIKKAEVLGDVLDSTDTKFSTDALYAEIKNRLVGGFRDFEYDELSVVFTRDGGRFVARIETRGRARTGVRQEFGGVTLNFWEFDTVLRDAILVSRKVFGK